VLNLIRKHQPLSRADLSRHSGLQRSTVSAITEELIAERWVMEGAMGQLPRGRKPTFLHLNGGRAGIIGVDLRPVTTTIALAGWDARILDQETMPTGGNPAQFVIQLADRIRALMKAHPELAYEGIGVALPGRVDSVSQRLVYAPNLGWRDLDLKTPLARATGLSVELENAANACALAELWGGEHAEGVHHLVAVTVAEGIGVGMVLNGQLVRGPTGVAGEFGHVVLREDGPLCKCGNRGCWEVCASNTAAVRYYTEAVLRSRSARISVLPPTFDDLLRLADQGDVKACGALDQMAHYLGVGIAMLVTGLAPDFVVVYGEVTRAWERMGSIIDHVVRSRVPTHAKTRVLSANPAEQPRLRGAITLVLQKHFGVPAIA
jgi:predicted NBD/HSP70 family sugar kinase